MLNIICTDDKELTSVYIHDIENHFSKVLLKDDTLTKEILEIIEQGTYCDAYSFMDRYNTKCDRYNLSTGSKLCLCIDDNPNLHYNAIEVGVNTLNFIVTHFTTGTIVIPYDCIVLDCNETPIDVSVNNIRFTTLNSLTNYLRYDYPAKPLTYCKFYTEKEFQYV